MAFLQEMVYNPDMLSLEWINLWIIGPSIGFGAFLMLTLVFVLGRKHFRNPQNISFLIFAVLMLAVNISLMALARQAATQATSQVNMFTSGQEFIILVLLTLAASLAFYIFIEIEVSKSIYWLRLGIITGAALLLLATLADVGYLDFFPVNLNTGISGWVSAAMLLSTGFSLASAIFFYKNKYDHLRLFGIAPLIILIGLNLNILFIGSFFLSAVSIWVMYLGLTASTIFEGLIIPTARRIEETEVLNQELIDAYNTTLEGWAKALELRDKETVGHSRRVTELAEELAEALDLSEKERQDVRFGALLHDIGKMAIPDEILNKPGKLTPEERKIIETHPQEGFNLLEHISYLAYAAQISLHHHEKWDGSGYPDGLAGEEIPYLARLFAIVDVWDAITSERSYSNAWPIPMARAYLKDEKGVSFDPEIVDVFLRMEQTYKHSPDSK